MFILFLHFCSGIIRTFKNNNKEIFLFTVRLNPSGLGEERIKGREQHEGDIKKSHMGTLRRAASSQCVLPLKLISLVRRCTNSDLVAFPHSLGRIYEKNPHFNTCMVLKGWCLYQNFIAENLKPYEKYSINYCTTYSIHVLKHERYPGPVDIRVPLEVLL